jgi:hypothetical protein
VQGLRVPVQLPLSDIQLHPFSETHVALVVAAEHSVGVPLHAVPDQVHPVWAVHDDEVRWVAQGLDVP